MTSPRARSRSNPRGLERRGALDDAAAIVDEARLARRWLLHQMTLARERGQGSISVSLRILEALRPSIANPVESRQDVPRGPAAA